MRKIYFLIIILAISLKVYPETIVKDKYIWRQMTVKNRNYDVIEEFNNVKGVIILVNIEEKDYVSITIGEKSMYEVQIVNKVVDTSVKGVKIEMLQGRQKIQDKIITMSVFLTYFNIKNTSIPEVISVDIDGSDSIIEFSGLVKLD